MLRYCFRATERERRYRNRIIGESYPCRNPESQAPIRFWPHTVITLASFPRPLPRYNTRQTGQLVMVSLVEMYVHISPLMPPISRHLVNIRSLESPASTRLYECLITIRDDTVLLN
jgi:hypothetical protein